MSVLNCTLNQINGKPFLTEINFNRKKRFIENKTNAVYFLISGAFTFIRSKYKYRCDH